MKKQQKCLLQKTKYKTKINKELILKLINKLLNKMNKAIEAGVNVEEYIKLPFVSKIAKAKYVEESKIDNEFKDIEKAIDIETDEIIEKGGLTK